MTTEFDMLRKKQRAMNVFQRADTVLDIYVVIDALMPCLGQLVLGLSAEGRGEMRLLWTFWEP